MDKILKQLNKYCKPKVKSLDIKGEIGAQDSLRVGIIGSRQITSYGRALVKEVCRELFFQQATVVSGLMYGVDLEAQKEILKLGGRTIGVLGYGFDHLLKYSYANEVAKEILQKKAGAVISEFPKDQPAGQWTFPKRNRIVAALSDYLIIIEAGKNSGTLITADLALEMGKEVYVAPGSIFNAQSYGCNKLLSEGAIPLYDLSIIRKGPSGFEVPLNPCKINDLSAEASLVFDYLLDKKREMPVDKLELMKNTITSVNLLNAALSELELNSLITIEGDNVGLN